MFEKNNVLSYDSFQKGLNIGSKCPAGKSKLVFKGLMWFFQTIVWDCKGKIIDNNTRKALFT